MFGLRLAFFATVLLASLPALAQVAGPPPAGSSDQVVRLAPDRFPQLPSSIRSYLTTNGFTIPQCYLSAIFPGPHNVIRGHFRSATSTDWAVLASKEGVSRILVFFSGSGRDPAQLSEAPDSNFIQGPGAYSRHIRAASPKIILGYRAAYGEDESRVFPLTHEGIEDSFVEKGSSIHFLHNGHWLSLVGAD